VNQPVDCRSRLLDDRAASGDEDVRLLLGHLSQTDDEIADPACVSVVTADVSLRHGVLEAVEVQDSPVAVDQIAHEPVLESIDLDEIRDRPSRVARRVQDAHYEIPPGDPFASARFAIHPDGRDEHAGALLRVIVEPLVPEGRPEVLDL